MNLTVFLNCVCESKVRLGECTTKKACGVFCTHEILAFSKLLVINLQNGDLFNRFRVNLFDRQKRQVYTMAQQVKNVAGMFGSKGVGALVGLAGFGYAASQSFYSVEAGHRAIIFNRIGGIQRDVYAEGLHFKIPFIQYPIIYDIRSRPRKFSAPTGMKDLQMVNITLRVLARPDPTKLPTIYRTLGLDYDERVLPSICNEVSECYIAFAQPTLSSR